MAGIASIHSEGKLRMIKRDLIRNKGIYLMFVPVIVYFIMFHYIPMYGAQIAFRDYTPRDGITGSVFVGFKHFVSFFGSTYFWRLLRNTLLLSFLALLFGFPAPIILALLMNELRNKAFKRVVQTVTYLPYFISLMVVCSV